MYFGKRADSQSVRFAGCFSSSSRLLIVVLICDDVKQAAASSEVGADRAVDVGKPSAGREVNELQHGKTHQRELK